MRTILIHGASTAAGWFDMEYAGWANRLHLNALHANRQNPWEAVMIQNTSIPGNTLPGIMKELNQIEKFRRLGQVTTILAIGLNESKLMSGATRPLVSLDRFKSALNDYANCAESMGANVMYVGTEMLYRDTIVTENGNIFENDLVAEYDYLIEEEAARRGAPYVSLVNLFNKIGPEIAVAPDGYHPSAIGHAAIHGAVVDALRPFESFNKISLSDENASNPDITNHLTGLAEGAKG